MRARVACGCPPRYAAFARNCSATGQIVFPSSLAPKEARRLLFFPRRSGSPRSTLKAVRSGLPFFVRTAADERRWIACLRVAEELFGGGPDGAAAGLDPARVRAVEAVHGAAIAVFRSGVVGDTKGIRQ